MGDIKSDGRAMPVSDKSRKLRRLRFFVCLISFLCVLMAIGFFVRVPYVVWARGNVIAEEHAEVRPVVSGVVTGILVNTGSTVEQGDLLVFLDNNDELSRLQETIRQAQKAEAELVRRRAEITEQRRRWQEDEVVVQMRLRNAQSRLARTRELFDLGLVAGSAMEDDQLNVDLIQAELKSHQQRDWTVFDKELEIFKEEVAARMEAVVQTRAAVSAREIRAPVSGYVLRYDFVYGELVRPDQVLFEIFGGDRQLLKLRVPERHAVRVLPGNHYKARLATYQGLRRKWFYGEVLFLRHVIQYEGSSGYRVAYCSFESEDQIVPPGATAEAKIYCGRTRLWPMLLGLD